jgi:hypothetical protein
VQLVRDCSRCQWSRLWHDWFMFMSKDKETSAWVRVSTNRRTICQRSKTSHLGSNGLLGVWLSSCGTRIESDIHRSESFGCCKKAIEKARAMRPHSLHLFIVALLSNVVYGFSSSPTILASPSRSSTTLAPRPHRAAIDLSYMPRIRAVPLLPRGGANALKAMPTSTGTKCPATGAATILASLWGTGGVLYILAKAIKRVLPIALEPFQGTNAVRPLSQFELGYVIK